MSEVASFFLERSLNKDVPIPLYYQLKEILLEFVRFSPVGSCLPTEEQLCSIYQISRPTARQAIRDLEVSGNVVRIKGKGTFVADPKVRQTISAVQDFEDIMAEAGRKVGIKLLEIKRSVCEERGCRALDLSPRTDIYILRRLLSVDNVPMAMSLTYLPFDRFPELEKKNIETLSLNRLIRDEYGYEIKKAAKTLEAKIVSDFEAELFGVKKGSPVQYVETTSYLQGDLPIEFTMERFRADKNQITFTVGPKD
jgi:GntR family transcriptional regulator